MATRFSMETSVILQAAGWHPGRSVSWRQWADELRQAYDIATFPPAARFLAEFGGLRIHVPWQTTIIETAFDPSEAAEAFRDKIKDAEGRDMLYELVGGPVSIIGGHGGNVVLLLMDQHGAVYTLDDQDTWLGFTGPFGDAALERLCHPGGPHTGKPIHWGES